MNKIDKRIQIVLLFLSVLFISLIVYLSYFEIFTSSKIEKNSYNKRQWLDEDHILRGKILDRNGKVLAYSSKEGKNKERHYKYNSLYSHIIGYSYREYGKSGLEKTYNKELLDLTENKSINEIKKLISNEESKGNNLILTINHELQKYSKELLGDKKGAIVSMNPKNGDIYSMVSYPDFNPNDLKQDWNNIIENKESPLLNRSTSGLYTPGSIFKIITTTAALEEENINTNFQCDGKVNIDGYILKDYKGEAHGQVNLHESLVESCNVAFSQIGLQVGQEKLNSMSEKYMLNRIIPFDLETKKSKFPQKNMTKAELGASSIGQGEILVTPLNMAMMTSAIANDGKLVKPNLVKKIVSPNNDIIESSEVEVLSNVTSKEIAEKIKDMMIDVVDEGTGDEAKIRGIKVAGKTGTAENNKEKEHAWFVAFAPADNPQIAVAVVLENIGETGGSSAAPIARNIILKAINTIK